ncbi:MAG: Stk1 family PASTA domain-containing Ser/Thr kinase [Actinomycetota bacterium]|nr:Stk1 family PASTA domain-containing Ser/Thr kinase [Actinomycetota bacterium]
MSEDVRVLGGRYRVETLLGQGGMAEVYRGTDTVLGRAVAIKMLAPQYAKDQSFVDRFRREAQAAARLNQPNVVGVYDTGSDDGIHYIVMEYVEGRTLADFLSRGGRLLPERAIELTEAVCLALTDAHRAGIVHRDIKPGNIMVTRSGEVKVMDFGIARAASAETVTATATVLGTASYLSPEQAQGQPVDARSDIYSLGVVLYEMLTGRVPFTGDSAVAVAYKHVQEQPVPPSQLNPDVSPALESVVMRALAKNPDNRYQSADEFRQDLERLRRGVPVSATPLLPMVDTQVVHRDPAATRVQSPTSVLPPEERRQRWPWVLVGLLVLLGVLIALFFLGKDLLNKNANEVATPKLVGRTLTDAEAKLKESNLKLGTVTKTPNTSVRPDTVLSQSPAAGTKLTEGSTVSLVVAKPPADVKVPDLVTPGLTQADAETQLQAANLKLGNVTTEASDTVPKNQIISQNPPAGQQVPPGTAVDIVVSKGQSLVTVPNLTCQPLGQAEAHLKALGLTLAQSGNTSFVDSCPHAGRVASQDPASGAQVAPGTAVTVDETEAATKPTSSPSP